FLFFFALFRSHLALHSFPTRRSSVLLGLFFAIMVLWFFSHLIQSPTITTFMSRTIRSHPQNFPRWLTTGCYDHSSDRIMLMSPRPIPLRNAPRPSV